MAHDFEKYPELTNGQMSFYYFESPHKQILEDFSAEVVAVHDGDTIRLRWNQRDFDFPLRFSNIAAAELDEKGGKASGDWLRNRILGKIVDVGINYHNRVEKWGRILGTITHSGLDVGLESVMNGKSVLWSERLDGVIP